MDPFRETLHGTQSSGAGRYQCTQCQRTYTRVDHLARHVRSHLQQRPFQCQTCHKSFGRADLLKRHAQSHEEAENNLKRPRLVGTHQSRVSTACRGCAIAKVKCDDEKPCTRCHHMRIQCQFSHDPRYDRAPRKSQDVTQLGAYNEVAEDDHTPFTECQRAVDLPTPSSVNSAHVQVHPSQDTPLSCESNTSPDALLSSGNQFSEFLRDVMTTTDMSSFGASGQGSWSGPNFSSWDVLDFGMEGDAELDWPSFTFQDHLYNARGSDMQPPFLQNSYTHQQSEQRPAQRPARRATPNPPVGRGVEAFRKSSLSRWLPGQQDNTATHMTQLSVGVGNAVSSSPLLYREREIPKEAISTVTRNSLLSMIMSTCDTDKGAAIASSFPPSQLLDELVQSYMVQNRKMSSSFIHAPTFSPNAGRTEVLGGVIAAGAVLSDIKAFRELGLAMQEALDLVIMKRCEKENTLTRELWLMQTMMFVVEIALWSGSKRKMEIAESHSRPLFTMIRRSGKFQKWKNHPPPPSADDSGPVLHQKWLDWARHESYKRLAFCAFLLDAQMSMGLLVSPQLSYAEMLLPFPESNELWMAEDAEQWRNSYLSLTEQPFQEPSASLASFIQEPLRLSSLPSCYDLQFSTLALLHGLWGMIWECTQLTSVLGNRSGHSGATTALHQTLCQMLDDVRMAVAEVEAAETPEVSLLFGLLTLYLHISLEKIQLFAGKEDLEEARRVFPDLQEWAVLPGARRAICGAGQVLRAAKALSSRQLRNFQAIAVYHAGLTCWAYGLIALKNVPPRNVSVTSQSGSPIKSLLLDGPFTAETKRFISLGHGIPGVGYAEDDEAGPVFIPLSDPVALMRVVLGILQDNSHPQMGSQSTPPLVDNLLQLIIDLGDAGLSVVNNLEDTSR